jgi:hypothetical protein
MFDWNALLQRLQQMKMPDALSKLGKGALTKLLSWPLSAKLVCGMLLLLLAGSLMGCATTSAPSTNTPRNPEPPPSVLPQSSPGYLGLAHDLLSTWRKQLNELTTKPAH